MGRDKEGLRDDLQDTDGINRRATATQIEDAAA
jgi:hypothetical protein